jgi:hypothetical protein
VGAARRRILAAPVIQVVALPHPFRPSRQAFVLDGRPTLEDIVVEVAQRADMPLGIFAGAGVAVGDVLVPKEHWRRCRPKRGQVVTVNVVPGDPVSLSLAAIGSAASWGAAALVPTAFALAHPLATAAIVGLAQAGIGIVTSLAIGALSSTPKQRNAARDAPPTARYSIQGIRNESRPYRPIPKIYGQRERYYPVQASLPYTEISYGDEQIARMIFDVGYGPLDLSNIRIGETPIDEFEDCEYQIRYGYPDDAPITLFPSQVREAALSIQLRQVDGYVLQTTSADADEATFDIQFPSGLQRTTDRNEKKNVTVGFEAQIRPASGGPWVPAPLVQSSGGVEITGGTGLFQVIANAKSAVRRSLRIVFPSRQQWQVQIRRLTQDDQADNVGDNQSVTSEESYLTAFRSFQNTAPIRKSGIARIAIRCRSTNQLNGVIDNLNLTVKAILPVWNGSTWTEQITRSPAWAFCDVLRGSANKRPVAASRIDLDRMLEFATQCAADGVTFDADVADVTSVAELLDDIAGTANAKRIFRNGLFSVALDNTKTEIAQHFTPRNSRRFGVSKLFARRPHAIKVVFPNAATYHQQDEIIVYDDGYTAANAELFETLELPYTTEASQAWRRGRRAMFAARLRPRVIALETDAEHIACEIGSLVRVSHDVPQWGGAIPAARVRALVTSGSDTTGVELDAPVIMATGTAYVARFRLADGESLVVPVDTVDGEHADLTFTSPVATADGPEVGDLVQFGPAGRDSVELVVRTIEPLPDLGARITFQDYAAAIQTSATGEIPEFDPGINVPPVVNRTVPPRVLVQSVNSDEGALIRASDGTLTSRILLSVALDPTTGTAVAEIIQSRYREAGTTDDYRWLPTLPAQGGELSILPVEDGTAYEVQLRSVSQTGATADWTAITHTVVGKTAPPPNVERFYRTGNALTWPYDNPPIDLAGFRLRAQYGTSTDWGSARALTPGLVTAPPFDIAALAGTQTILIKAVDSSGIESLEAATLTLNLGDVLTANVVETQSEAPTWSGTLEGGTDSGANIEADLVSSPPFYGPAAAAFYGVAGDAFYEAAYYGEMSYVARYTPDTLYLGDGVLKLEVTVAGDYAIDYRISTSPAFYGTSGDPLYGSADDPFYEESAIGAWQPWPGKLGPFETVADTYDIRITTAPGAVQGVASQFDLITDLPDVRETIDSFSIAASGTVRLPITKAYRVIKNVQLTREDDGGTAVEVYYLDKDATLGPEVRARNAAGTRVSGTADAIIEGY